MGVGIHLNKGKTRMSYYDDEKNVQQYIQMAEGYDGAELIAILKQHLPKGASVLELGMGEGKDVLLLQAHYTVTGSDASPVFVERFRTQYPDADVLQLDAVTLDTERQFDALYSNKVLYHLTQEQLKHSLERQVAILKEGGLALHSFWHGEGADSAQGLHFEYYTEAQLRELVEEYFDVVVMARYTEMEKRRFDCCGLT
jgi:cyclopropane fatty-acyl-phospholipid synthase-like methyltransferase